MFDRQVITDAMRHAATAYPQESCGLVVDGAYLPMENTAEAPEADFRIAPKAYLVAKKKGEVEAVIHSHANAPDYPSEVDQIEQIRMGLAWGIVPMDKDVPQEPFFWGGNTPAAPLLGRKFRPGVHDCYSLARDWYQGQGIVLPELPRSDAWWVGDEDNRFLDRFQDLGFEPIEGDPEPGDGVLMQVCSSNVNHCGVYIGNGLLLHHLQNRFSREEPYHRWHNHVRMVIRRVEK